MSIADLSQLPPPDIIEPLDFEAIYARRVAAFIAQYPAEQQAAWADTLNLESDPVAKLLQENAYNELLLRARINDAARATMLAYASGADLDHIGAMHNTLRKTIFPADDSTTPPTPAIIEPDSEYRRRIQLAYESLSTAGPRDAYIWHALAAHADVADASVTSPSPAHVTISVLSRSSNGTAETDVINAVKAAVNAEHVRPIADRVTVQSASITDYTITASIYTYPQPEIEPILAAARRNANQYAKEQRRLGRDITRSALFAALHVPGVQRVELTEPAVDIELDAHEAGYCTAININHGGVDE